MSGTGTPRASRSDWILALMLVLLAVAIRWYQIDLVEFKLDEATHYRLATSLLQGEWRWAGSTSSFGIPKPPFFTWAIAVPLGVSRDPRVVTGFLGLLASLACGGFFLILRRYLDRASAFSAGLLFAANPTAIVYSRKLFTADLIPPLCTLLLGAGMAFLAAAPSRVGRWAVAVALAFAAMLLTTFSPFLLTAAVALLLFLRKQDLTSRQVLAAGVALCLPFVPYLLATAPQVSGAIQNPGGAPTSAAGLGRRMWVLLFGAPWPSDGPPIALVAATGLGLLSLAGAIWLTRRTGTHPRERWALFFVAWLASVPLLALVLPIDVELHYLVVLYPLLFVLPAGGVQWAFERKRWLGLGAVAAVALAAGWQANVWLDSMRAVQRGVEGYGTPLGYWRETAEHARQLAKQQEAAEILLVMPGDQPWDEKASILHTLLADSPHRTVDGQQTTVLPIHATLLVVASELPTALRLTGSARDLGDPLPASPFGGTYLFRMWSGGSVSAPLGEWSASPEPAAWASGARLLGYRFAGVPGPGRTVQVLLWWETSRSAPDLDVHWFNHLVDGEGTKWAQLDHGAWPSHKWQPGDQVLTYFPLAIDAQAPPGAFWLRVGQYSYPEVANIPLVDGDGNHRSDWVQLPVLTSGS